MLSFSVTFVITIINFFVLFIALRAILWKPVRTFMAERTERIRRETSEAQVIRRSAEEMRQRYEDLLSNASDEAEWVVRDAEDEAAQRSREIVAKAEDEAAEIMRRSADRTALDLARARDGMAREIAAIATAAAASVGGASFDGEAERQAALEFVRSVAAMEARREG